MFCFLLHKSYDAVAILYYSNLVYCTTKSLRLGYLMKIENWILIWSLGWYLHFFAASVQISFDDQVSSCKLPALFSYITRKDAASIEQQLFSTMVPQKLQTYLIWIPYCDEEKEMMYIAGTSFLLLTYSMAQQLGVTWPPRDTRFVSSNPAGVDGVFRV